jgi:hypothetical protein
MSGSPQNKVSETLCGASETIVLYLGGDVKGWQGGKWEWKLCIDNFLRHSGLRAGIFAKRFLRCCDTAWRFRLQQPHSILRLQQEFLIQIPGYIHFWLAV